MQEQFSKIITGNTEQEFKQNLDSFLSNTINEDGKYYLPVINIMYIDLPNTRGLFIYSKKYL